MQPFKAGDRVRYTLEGKVICANSAFLEIECEPDNSRKKVVSLDRLSSAEKVELIEPEYEPGACYMDDDGTVFFRRYNSSDFPWRAIPDGSRFAENYPTRPLRKLVPREA